MKSGQAMWAAIGVATVLTAGAAGAGDGVRWAASRSGCGGGFEVSVGRCCPRPPVVAYVPVIVTAPACAWGTGTRTVLVTTYMPRYYQPTLPVMRFGGLEQRLPPPLPHGGPARGYPGPHDHGSHGGCRR